MSPVVGSMATAPASMSRPFTGGSRLATAASSAFWADGSIVVVTRRPPEITACLP